MNRRVLHLISWQKSLFPAGGDFSPPNTCSSYMIFRVGGSRAPNFCGYVQVRHCQYTAPHQQAIPFLPMRTLKALCSSQHKTPKSYLVTGLKSQVMSWKQKKSFLPHIMPRACWHCRAHHECWKKRISLNLFQVKMFW